MRPTIDGSRAEASVKHAIEPNNWSTAKSREYTTVLNESAGKKLTRCKSCMLLS